MASVRRMPNGRYQARYRDESGREHAQRFDRKIDAERWIDEATAAMVSGRYVDPRAGRVSFADYAGQWERGLVQADGTARIVDNALRLHLLPKLGERPLAGIRRSDLQSIVRALSETHAPGTVRNVVDVAGRVFSAAVEDRLISETPCRRLVLPKVADHQVSVPTVGAVASVREAIAQPSRSGWPRRDDLSAGVVTLAGSGLRIGELLGLDVAHVDFLRRTVRVERQRYQDGYLGPPKTPQSVRTVPLGDVVLRELAAMLAQRGSHDGPLFLDPRGGPLMYAGWKRAWNRALRATELDMDTHDLRHFYASALISGGASVKQVQTALGHSSAVVTLRVYAHLWPGDEDRTRAITDAALEGLADNLRTTATALA